MLAWVCAGAMPSALAHTPYGQWQVYRRKHLLVGCHKDSERTYSLAKQIVNELETYLPEASARVARAPTAQRIASLMATDQMEVAVLSLQNALDMMTGEGKFKPFGQIPLRVLMTIDDWMLVCSADMPDRHAWLVSDALLHSFAVSDNARDTGFNDLEWHAGAFVRFSGLPMPE
jgi:hypothetical protein